jgi:cytochrome P450
MPSNTAIFDPTSPESRADPYPLYQRLRSDAPVHWSPAVRGWVALRYTDVQHVLHTAGMSADRITPFYKSLSSDGQSKVEILVHYLGRWLVFRDPPDHTRLRGLIARALTPKAMATIRPNIVAITDHLLQSVEGRANIDLVNDFANLLPAFVIMDMLGVPRGLLPDMKGWSDDIKLFIGTSHNVPDKYERARRGVEGMAAAFRTLIADHRKSPRHDVLTTLITANEDGSGRLDDEELIATAILFLPAMKPLPACSPWAPWH